jgi:hypothetical protein
MEHEEIIKCFIRVAEDSFTESNKIGHNQTSFILNQIDKDIRNVLTDSSEQPFNYTETLIRFIDIVRARRPGYVNQDILNILILGFGEQLGSDADRMFHIDSFRKWFYEYGIKRDKDTSWTVRNKWLRDTYNYMKWEREKAEFSQDFKGIPLFKLLSLPDADKKFKYLKKFIEQDFEKEIKETIREPEVNPEIESMASSDSDGLPF